MTHRTHFLGQSVNLKTHVIFTICHWAEGRQEPTSCWIAKEEEEAHSHTDTHPDTQRQRDYWGHPFRVSGFFPSTYHQGSAQKSIKMLFPSNLWPFLMFFTKKYILLFSESTIDDKWHIKSIVFCCVFFSWSSCKMWSGCSEEVCWDDILFGWYPKSASSWPQHALQVCHWVLFAL